MEKQTGYTSISLLVVAVWLVGLGGWIANIVKLAGESFSDISGMLVLRVVGIFVAPLGSVLGFL